MNQKQISTIKRHLTIKDGEPVTTSLDIATFFGMKHKDVLRAIENKIADCPTEFVGRNFALVSYVDNHNQQRPMYELTRKGFDIVALGFTGPKAMEFQIAYVEAFEQKEQELQQKVLAGRADAVIGTLAITAAIARSGYKADFLARMVHLRFAGLTVKEVGRVLGVSKDVVVRWSSVLRKAGVDFPKSAKPAAALLKSAGRQLCLPGLAS